MPILMAPSGRVGIIGAGAAGLVTGQILLKDGFDVQLITRDSSAGGVWARERIYPGLTINNVHGEFRFSSLPMPPPDRSTETGGRLSGDDMCNYMETFASTFLDGKIKYQMEIIGIKRRSDGIWDVAVKDLRSGKEDTLEFDRVVLCSGGCSAPHIPPPISSEAAQKAGFGGRVIHTKYFRDNLDDILERTNANQPVVVVGGGKSAQDVATYLAKAGRKVSVVFEKADAILATSIPLPYFIRRSRFLPVLSPHIELRTRLERFLHTTWLGSKIVHFIWNAITSTGFDAFHIPKGSPLRNAQSLFWGIRTNDEGAYRPGSFHALVNNGQIELVAPARVLGYGADGHSLVLSNGRSIGAEVILLATGYESSWTGLFDEQTSMELGLKRHPPLMQADDEWTGYTSLSNPPPSSRSDESWASPIYRGIVPAHNISRRDFAINGAVFTTNNGYVFEVVAHWISSYFLNDKMRLPSSAEEALADTERNSAWLKKRYPNMLQWVNESYSSNLAFFSWPQFVDDILEDMYLPSQRSGGNWLTWPFKVIKLEEIADLAQERKQIRV